MYPIALPSPRHLAWLPAALLIAYAIAAATGFAITPESRAASSTTTVTASVGPELHMAITGCAGAGTETITTTGTAPNWVWAATIDAAPLSAADSDVSLGTCTTTFGTNNNTLGADLLIENTRSAGNSLCATTLPADCNAADATFIDVGSETPATFAAGESPTAGKFGVTYTKTACVNGFATTNRNGLPTTPGLVCETSSTTDGTVTTDYRVNPGANQSAVAYSLQTVMTVVAN